jgi:hypothetical protein
MKECTSRWQTRSDPSITVAQHTVASLCVLQCSDAQNPRLCSFACSSSPFSPRASSRVALARPHSAPIVSYVSCEHVRRARASTRLIWRRVQCAALAARALLGRLPSVHSCVATFLVSPWPLPRPCLRASRSSAPIFRVGDTWRSSGAAALVAHSLGPSLHDARREHCRRALLRLHSFQSVTRQIVSFRATNKSFHFFSQLSPSAYERQGSASWTLIKSSQVKSIKVRLL